MLNTENNESERVSSSVVSDSLQPHGLLTFSSPGDLPNPGIEPGSPALQADSLPSEPLWKPYDNKALPIINDQPVWLACVCVQSYPSL